MSDDPPDNADYALGALLAELEMDAAEAARVAERKARLKARKDSLLRFIRRCYHPLFCAWSPWRVLMYNPTIQWRERRFCVICRVEQVR